MGLQQPFDHHRHIGNSMTSVRYSCVKCRRCFASEIGLCRYCNDHRTTARHRLKICESNRCQFYGKDKEGREGCLQLPKQESPRNPCFIFDHLLAGGGCLASPPLFTASPVRRKAHVKDGAVNLNPFMLKDTARDDCEIITFHYNPVGFQRLRETYYEWFPSITSVEPKCYEVTFDDDLPEIESSTRIIGTRADNLMWQKEAVMNHALKATTAKYFAWVDHDLVFSDPYWLTKAIELLDAGHVAVQLFSKVIRLGLDRSAITDRSSAMAGGAGNPGGAWIASTEFLREIGGFETSNLFGGGDQVFHDCFVGRPGGHIGQYSPRLAEAITRWVANAASVRGKRTASYVDQTAYHLWHGDIKDRQYSTRYRILKDSDFDPQRDIEIQDNGLLRWSSHKSELHEWVSNFFANRREDG